MIDTNNGFGVEVSLLYFISPIVNFQDQGLCMCTRLPGLRLSQLALMFTRLCLQLDATSVRGQADLFVKLTYVCSTQML